jgi:hypothetical protein
MTIYDRQNMFADFGQRTRDNLKLIRDARKEEPKRKVYEVTQLINSMLGLLIFPKANDLGQLRDKGKRVRDLRKEGWPIPEATRPYHQATTLNALITRLRNAVAHCNMDFHPDGKGDIARMTMWTKSDNGRGPKNWEMEMTIEELDGIATRFIELVAGSRSQKS